MPEAVSRTIELARALNGFVAGLEAGATPAERQQQLVTLAPRADSALGALEAIYRDAPQPMENHEREALAVARALALGLARAYKSSATQSKGKVALPVFKAMTYVAAAMRASYQTYSKVPDGTWREMNELYRLAQEKGVATLVASAQSGMSISDYYGECLLLSLTDPYRLAPGELAAIVALLRAKKPTISLGKEAPDTRATAHFIACDADVPPRPLRESDALPAGAYVFDTTAVVDPLRAAMEREPAGEARSLITKLVALWEDPPKRAFRRDPAQGSVAICVGVKPIAHFVAHDADADGEAETKALREGITMPLRALPEDEAGHAIPIHEWAVINMSSGGARVRRTSSTNYPVTVGEIVGIRGPGKVLWTIGATRWVTGLEDGTIEFGLQFFANAVCAVWVKEAASSGRKLGLLVAEGDDHAEESLLTPPGTYAELAEFELRGEGFRSRVRASRLVEKNSRFDLFRVVAL
ncbi:MAG TPA: hypothetical protein VM051_06660 [Usitatibacter sp.]|nr:hypothetical protein [Usitatibacter sp.]